MIIPPYCPLMSLSNDQPDRTVMERDAPAGHAQQMLRGVCAVPNGHAGLPDPKSKSITPRLTSAWAPAI
jgi:hypothetical protein